MFEMCYSIPADLFYDSFAVLLADVMDDHYFLSHPGNEQELHTYNCCYFSMHIHCLQVSRNADHVIPNVMFIAIYIAI